MAAFITHVIAGEEALKWALGGKGGTLDALGTFASYFRLGCQGPDIFYHNQRTRPSGLHYGALAHRRNYGSLIAGAFSALTKTGRRPDSPEGAYLLGLATHAAVDRATHPFIVCFSGWVDRRRPDTERFRGCHPFFERLLDLAYLARERGMKGADCDFEALLGQVGADTGERGGESAGVAATHGAERDLRLVPLWAAGLKRAYPRSAGSDFLIEKRIENALADGRYFYSITNPAVTALDEAREDWFAYLDDRAGPRTVALVYPDGLPADLDLMNEAKAAWPHPADDGRVSDASYPELVDAAVGEASSILRLLLGAMEEDAAGPGAPAAAELAIASAIGDGGLSIRDPDGAHAAPRICRPLPLREVMEGEYRKRIEWARRLLRPIGLDAPGAAAEDPGLD